MKARQSRRCGNALIEFTLVGIPMIFVLISIFEMARGMWIYHTMAYAIKEGARYAIVHGNNCVYNPNNCPLQVRDVARRIQDNGVGLVPSELQLRFASLTRAIPGSTTYDSLENLLNNTASWPTYAKGYIDPASGSLSFDAGAIAGADLTITGQYPFRSALAMFWPGAGRPMQFGTFMLPATSTERIQF
ncbi:MAG: pilus assembly protein [Acidobacteriales bacterium]|nr:pilus assembly protein [Terriglobales bacterium]